MMLVWCDRISQSWAWSLARSWFLRWSPWGRSLNGVSEFCMNSCCTVGVGNTNVSIGFWGSASCRASIEASGSLLFETIHQWIPGTCPSAGEKADSRLNQMFSPSTFIWTSFDSCTTVPATGGQVGIFRGFDMFRSACFMLISYGSCGKTQAELCQKIPENALHTM